MYPRNTKWDEALSINSENGRSPRSIRRLRTAAKGRFDLITVSPLTPKRE
jgi:hypothetical protein